MIRLTATGPAPRPCAGGIAGDTTGTRAGSADTAAGRPPGAIREERIGSSSGIGAGNDSGVGKGTPTGAAGADARSPSGAEPCNCALATVNSGEGCTRTGRPPSRPSYTFS